MTSEDRAITYKVGDIVGSDYCLLERLGEGGMGMVFRAKHMIMQSIYALKILRPEQITTATWMRFQAEGDFSLPADGRLCFRLDGNTGEVGLLSRFNVDEFSELRCSAQSLEKLTDIISKWTKLTNLYLEDFFYDSDKELGNLDRLKHLQSLSLSHCAFPSKSFTQLKILSSINALHLENVKDSSSKSNNIDALFEGFARHKNLRDLWLHNIILSHKTVKEISTNPGIMTLTIISGDENNVLTDEDILNLASMPSLMALNIGNAHLSSKAIQYFKSFKHLTSLNLPKQAWSSANRKKLEAMYPNNFRFTPPSIAKNIREQF
ncbi:MAG: hypothetical protein JSS83_04885 [Cyanobacteria bacterium SZAS LIN-3]|nr:hypothetical protein [Cyanobacteria bacterium SZAS LIN-3]